jgi:hypothetical protein
MSVFLINLAITGAAGCVPHISYDHTLHIEHSLPARDGKIKRFVTKEQLLLASIRTSIQ